MLINLIQWIFITLVCLPLGLVVEKLFKLRREDRSIGEWALLGLIPLVFISTILAFFYHINVEVLLGVSVVSAAIGYKNRIELARIIRDAFRDKWEYIPWILLIIIEGIYAAKPTNIPDDGLYYLQTVKWANEVGIEPLVIRFGYQYGQFTAWHITQALFNFGEFFATGLIRSMDG